MKLYENRSLSQNYSKHRPTYPEDLRNKIYAFAEKHGVDTKMALDLACGTGLSTFPLTDRFQRTIGVDISQSQLECAREEAKNMSNCNRDVEFFASSASNMPFQDESVDVVTCATAWHWLDQNTVFPEVDRVLKRPGVLAVYSYCSPVIRHKECNKAFQDFMDKCMWADCPYGNGRYVCDSHYKDVTLPYPIAERYEMEGEVLVSLDDIRGLALSLDSYATYCREHPDNTAIEDMLQDMKNSLLGEDEQCQLSEVTVRMAVPYFLLLGVKL